MPNASSIVLRTTVFVGCPLFRASVTVLPTRVALSVDETLIKPNRIIVQILFCYSRTRMRHVAPVGTEQNQPALGRVLKPTKPQTFARTRPWAVLGSHKRLRTHVAVRAFVVENLILKDDFFYRFESAMKPMSVQLKALRP